MVVVVGVVVGEVVTDVVGVVMVHSRNKPFEYAVTISFNASLVSSHSLLSFKNLPMAQSIVSVRPSGPVNSVIALFNALNAKAQFVAPPVTPRNVLSPSWWHDNG